MTLRQITESDVIDALRRAGYDVKREGSEWHSGCPCCGEGKDRLRVSTRDGTLITHCRNCGADGPSIWTRLGLLDRAGRVKEPKPLRPVEQTFQQPSRRRATRNPDPPVGHIWLCHGPDGQAGHRFNGRDQQGKKRFAWPPGSKASRLLYLPRGHVGESAFIVEGEKAADAVCRFTSDKVRVIGTVCGRHRSRSEEIVSDVHGEERIERLITAIDKLTEAVNRLNETAVDLPEGVREAVADGIGMLGHDETVNAIRELPDLLRDHPSGTPAAD